MKEQDRRPSGKPGNTPDDPSKIGPGKGGPDRDNAPTRPNTPPGDGGAGGDGNPTTGVVVKARPRTRKPTMYKVLMLNDDYTPMEFVVHVLERFFQKNRDEATRIMLHVHRRGVGVCGVFTYEVAETKVTQVMDLARQNQHPLQCTIEKD
ncbi:ATP-dependent Clp protease adapter ClpS [Roseomonas sp. WA12]